MEKYNFRASYNWIAMLVLASLVIQGSGQDSSCLNQLAPCLNYLNGTRDVPDTCCNPLKNVIKSDPQCMCSMISNQGARRAEQAGINVTDAQQLPGRCGLRVNPISCLTGAAGSPSDSNTRNSDDNSSSSVYFSPSPWGMIMMLAFFVSITLLISW